MENQEIRNDDYLGNLIRTCPVDCPSDDFVQRIMATIAPEPIVVAEKKTFYHYILSTLPYAALVLFCIFIFATSDLPFLNGLTGKGFIMNEMVPYIANMFSGIMSSFDSKFISWGLLVGIAGAFLFLVDRFFSRRTAI